MTALSPKHFLAGFSKEARADPRMAKYFDRLDWDRAHLTDVTNYNPFVAAGEGGSQPKNRTGFQDYFHALKNIGVEWQRLQEQDEETPT